MDKLEVIYQIKCLEKLLKRNLINDRAFCENNFEGFINMPTPTQMQIIEYILENSNGYVYQKDLENVLNLRRATVSGVLQTMEKNNLIKRSTDSVDTRTKKIMLNESAKEIYLYAQRRIDYIAEIAIKDVSEDKLQVFLEVVKQMQENINNGIITK